MKRFLLCNDSQSVTESIQAVIRNKTFVYFQKNRPKNINILLASFPARHQHRNIKQIVLIFEANKQHLTANVIHLERNEFGDKF